MASVSLSPEGHSLPVPEIEPNAFSAKIAETIGGSVTPEKVQRIIDLSEQHNILIGRIPHKNQRISAILNHEVPDTFDEWRKGKEIFWSSTSPASPFGSMNTPFFDFGHVLAPDKEKRYMVIAIANMENGAESILGLQIDNTERVYDRKINPVSLLQQQMFDLIEDSIINGNNFGNIRTQQLIMTEDGALHVSNEHITQHKELQTLKESANDLPIQETHRLYSNSGNVIANAQKQSFSDNFPSHIHNHQGIDRYPTTKPNESLQEKETNSSFEETLREAEVIKPGENVISLEKIFDSGRQSESWIYAYKIDIEGSDGKPVTRYVKERCVLSMGGGLKQKTEDLYHKMKSLEQAGMPMPKIYGYVKNKAVIYTDFIVNDQTKMAMQKITDEAGFPGEGRDYLDQLIKAAVVLDRRGYSPMGFLKDFMFDGEKKQFLLFDPGVDLGIEGISPNVICLQNLCGRFEKHATYIRKRYQEYRQHDISAHAHQ